jgi:hypothetical protein
MVDKIKLKKTAKTLLQFSMQYGVVLGIFWFLKYIFFIAFDLFDHLWYVYYSLNIGTLLIYYVLINRYRDKALDGGMGYLRCIIFSTLLFFFASLIESIIIYIHVAIINPGFLAKQGPAGIAVLEELIKIFRSSQSINVAKPLKLASNAEYIINNIYVSTLYGFILSLIYGIFVTRKAPKQDKNL